MIREKLFNLLFLIILVVPSLSLAQEATDATTWFQQAQEARQSERFDDAHKALDKAAALGFAPLRVSFERARVHTLADEPSRAVAELRSIADAGFTAVGFVVNDAILSTLAGNEGYDSIVAEMSAKAYPCQNDEAFRAFDFWLGEWVVELADGTVAGSNTIAAHERGCVLVERWSSAGGGTGMSINYLDKATDEWVQIWNAEGGSQIHIRGGMTDKGMLLVGTLHTVGNGTTVPFRGLWTPLEDGRVRQFFEQSLDDGATWSPWFEGFYKRKE
jgi:hypothetical protein